MARDSYVCMVIGYSWFPATFHAFLLQHTWISSIKFNSWRSRMLAWEVMQPSGSAALDDGCIFKVKDTTVEGCPFRSLLKRQLWLA